MLAPPAGRYLGAAAVALALGYAAWASDLLPRNVAVLLLLVVPTAGLLGLAAFFRDPERAPEGAIVSAADGVVRAVDRDATSLRISVFMSVGDVHVNRFPVDGVVGRIDNAGAGFRPAYLEDSRHNVRRHYHLATELGGVEVIQMTGIVARRLVSYVSVGDRRSKGDRLGMIALGSRVDILFPAERVDPVVAVGARVRAGETEIARPRP